MARTLGRPDLGKVPMPMVRVEKAVLLGTDNFDAGWIADLAAVRIPDNAFSDIQNFTYARGRIIVQNGTTEYSLGNADNNKVLGFFVFNDLTVGLNFLRFDREKIYKATGAGWVEVTPDVPGTALSGGDQSYFSFAQGDGRYFFSNWGVDPIREIDPSVPEYKPLGNAPQYKYITTAFNRLVGAYLINSPDNPVQVGWSGDLNYDEWDPLVDPSAGSQPLIDNPSDVNDLITGLFSISTFLIVPRSGSMWVGQNQPSSTKPFYFFSPLPYLGADLPRCITRTDQGVVWFNFNTGGVYLWVPPEPSTLVELSGAVGKTLKNIVQAAQISLTEVFSSYNPDQKVYSIFINLANSVTTIEISYSFKSKTWYKSTWISVSAVGDFNFSGTSVSIDELPGIIDDLAGTINELGGGTAVTSRFMGWDTGAIFVATSFSGDYDLESSALVATSVEAFVKTKLIQIPIEDTEFEYVRFEYTPYLEGTITLEVYTDEKLHDLRATVTDTIDSSMIDMPQIIFIKKPVHTRQVIFKLIVEESVLELTGFYVNGLKSGVSTK